MSQDQRKAALESFAKDTGRPIDLVLGMDRQDWPEIKQWLHTWGIATKAAYELLNNLVEKERFALVRLMDTDYKSGEEFAYRKVQIILDKLAKDPQASDKEKP